jgi:alkylation response protein AidB-like acyl-CoA dehydrogenase
MNYDWTPEEQETRSNVAGAFDEDHRKELAAIEEGDLARLKDITGRCLSRLGEIGYLSLGVGPDAKIEAVTLIAAQEEMAKISASMFLAAEAHARLFGGLLARFGDEETKAEILAPVQRGEMIAAVAMSEPEDPHAPNEWATTAVLEGDEYVVSGQKSFVTNAPIADYVAIACTMDRKPAFLLVQTKSPGLEIGPRLGTLGYRGLAVGGLELNSVRVPKNRVLGSFDDRTPLDFLSQAQDIALVVASVSLIQNTVAFAKDYAQSHQRGGKPIFHYQEIRFKMADMLTLSHSAQLLAYRAAWFASISDPEAATVLHCAKVFAAEASEQVTGLAMQIMAGQGYVSGNPVERGFRDAKFAAISGTTSEKARMAIAEDLLTKYHTA